MKARDGVYSHLLRLTLLTVMEGTNGAREWEKKNELRGKGFFFCGRNERTKNGVMPAREPYNNPCFGVRQSDNRMRRGKVE